MAGKKISELTSITPILTDLVPIDRPTTGAGAPITGNTTLSAIQSLIGGGGGGGNEYWQSTVAGNIFATGSLAAVTGSLWAQFLSASNGAVVTGTFRQGTNVTTSGAGSHAQGDSTTASGYASHSEGYLTTTANSYSHAEGENTTAIGQASHAEGYYATASGSFSHAEGSYTEALADNSHAEGGSTIVGKLGYLLELVNPDTVSQPPYAIYAISSVYGDVTAQFLYDYSDIIVANSAGTNSGIYARVSQNFDGTNTYITASSTYGKPYDGTYAISNLNTSPLAGANALVGGEASHAEGNNTIAVGVSSHTEGSYSISVGLDSHTEGYTSRALGDYSHSEGASTTLGTYSHAEGVFSSAVAYGSHAEGSSNQTGKLGYALSGLDIITEAPNAIYEISSIYGDVSSQFSSEDIIARDPDNYNIKKYQYVSASYNSITLKTYVTASDTFGVGTYYGQGAFSFGDLTSAGLSSLIKSDIFFGYVSHAEGENNITYGDCSHAEGSSTQTYGMYSHAEGISTIAAGIGSHAEGYYTTGSENFSHAEGLNTYAAGIGSHAEGYSTTASGNSSHSEGYFTIASGSNSHAAGSRTLALGNNSHTEGGFTTGSGIISHAEGYYTLAAGNGSHAEGAFTTGFGQFSHAEGSGSIAFASASHAEGLFTIASGSGQLTVGKYNQRNNDFSLFVIGDGTADGDANRSDIVRVNSGTLPGSGSFEVTGTVRSTLGFSGSLTQLTDGSSYLIAGTGIQIVTASNGSVTVATTGGGGGLQTGKQHLAAMTTTTATSALAIGQFSWVPADYTGLSSVTVRAIMSTDGSANHTGSLQVYNLTSGSYLDLVNMPAVGTFFEITSSIPTLVTSSNLIPGLTNFDNSSTAVYEVRVSGSSANNTIIGGVELVFS